MSSALALLLTVALAQLAPPSAAGPEVQISTIPVVQTDSGDLHRVPIVRGHAASAQHPNGTVYVYATDTRLDEASSRPYVFEWDLASGVVLHSVLGSAMPIGPSGGLDFDGRRVVTLDVGALRSTVTVRDEQLRPQHTRRVVADQVVLGGERILLSSQREDKAGLAWLDLQLFDVRLRARARRSVVAPAAMAHDSRQIGYGRGAFYALSVEPKTLRTFVVRLDGKSLRELGRTLVGEVDDAALSVVDDRVLVASHDRLVELGLDIGHVKTTLGSISGPFAWSPTRILESSGSYTGPALGATTCTPLWMEQRAVYACRGRTEFTMVRPNPRLLPQLEWRR